MGKPKKTTKKQEEELQEPRFETSIRYKDKDGNLFGKGVWFGYHGEVLQPGWGDFNRGNRTVTQYNTDGTKTVYTWEQWQDRQQKKHELQQVQNDRKYAIPYIPSKEMAISIDKNSPTRRNAGATLSENLLDSIALNAKKAGLPFGTGLGIVSQEATFGHNPEMAAGESLQPWQYFLDSEPSVYRDAANKVSYNGVYSPSLLISNWESIRTPFAAFKYDGKENLLKEPRDKGFIIVPSALL